MRDDNDNNYISVGGWMLLLLVPLIPVVGWILMIVLAFVGSNQTRKNYYRAMLAWILLLIVGFFLLVFVFDALPAVQQYMRDWQAKHH
jgi:uncharacterized membrane protein